MAPLYDLSDRIAWEQACRIIGCSRSTFFRLVREGRITAYGGIDRNRFYLRSECRAYLEGRGKRKVGRTDR